MKNDMKTSINLTLDGFDEPCYIVDKDAKMVDYNLPYSELIGVKKPDLLGRKVTDTKLYFNPKIEQDNLQFMAQAKKKYKFDLESYYDPSGRLGEVALRSHKMLIYDADEEVIGMLCRMKLAEGSNKLELKLKECLNALKAYTQFLAKEDCFLGQLDAIEGAKAIADSLALVSVELLGGRTPFWDRVYKRARSDGIGSYFLYKALIIYDDISSDLLVSLQSSYCIQFNMATHQELIEDEILRNRLKEGVYHIVVTDIIKPEIKLLTGATNTCYFGIRTASGAIHPSLSPMGYSAIVKNLSMQELINSSDDNLFQPWREYIAGMIKKRVAETKSLKILYVEDDENSRVSFERLISICPYIGDAEKGKCVGVSTPIEALNAVKVNEFDIIVLDIGLPEMDGFDLAVHIRQLQHQKGDVPCPIYGYTGHLIEAGELGHESCGVDKMFIKPELAIDINAVIRKFVPENTLI